MVIVSSRKDLTFVISINYTSRYFQPKGPGEGSIYKCSIVKHCTRLLFQAHGSDDHHSSSNESRHLVRTCPLNRVSEFLGSLDDQLAPVSLAVAVPEPPTHEDDNDNEEKLRSVG
jgi:hypothetical protein